LFRELPDILLGLYQLQERVKSEPSLQHFTKAYVTQTRQEERSQSYHWLVGVC